MEDKIYWRYALRTLAGCFIALMILIYMPNITACLDGKINDFREYLAEVKRRDEMTAFELFQFHAENIAAEEERVTDSIRIYLNGNLSLDDVTVSSDMWAREVSVFLPDAKEGMLNGEPMIGSIDHISDISITETKKGLYIVFLTDMVIEPQVREENGYIYLTLATPKDIYDHVVVVDAGHGGKMPGAVVSGYKEKTINLKILEALKGYMDEEETVKVYYTRESDLDISLQDRADLANYTGADLFLSIHCNTVGNPFNKTSGVQTLYNEEYKGDSNLSKKWARMVNDEVCEATGARDKGLVKGYKIYVVRSTECPSALCEVGFLTNRDELNKLISEEYQDTIARALHDAIMKALEEGL